MNKFKEKDENGSVKRNFQSKNKLNVISCENLDSSMESNSLTSHDESSSQNSKNCLKRVSDTASRTLDRGNSYVLPKAMKEEMPKVSVGGFSQTARNLLRKKTRNQDSPIGLKSDVDN